MLHSLLRVARSGEEWNVREMSLCGWVGASFFFIDAVYLTRLCLCTYVGIPK